MSEAELVQILKRIAALLIYVPCTCGYSSGRRWMESHSSSCITEQARYLQIDIDKFERKANGGSR